MFSGIATAQTHNHNHGHKRAQEKPASMMMHMDMAKCMADMKAGQAKLDDLVAKMNAASAVDKAEATAAVVAEMARQQKCRHDERCD